MKKLLLTSALVAFSSASFAEIIWSGEAETGFRSHTDEGWVNDGTANGGSDGNTFFLTADLNANASATLADGVTATLDYGMEVGYGVEAGAHGEDDAEGVTFDLFPTLTLTSSVGRLVVGDIDHAAHEYASGFDSDISDAYFSENDGGLIARADSGYAGFKFGLSTNISNNADLNGFSTSDYLANIASADYDYEGDNQLFGYNVDGELSSAGYTVATSGEMMGATVAAAYESRPDETSSAGAALGYNLNGFTVALGVASRTIDGYQNGVGADGELNADARTYAIKAGYELNGITFDGKFWNTKTNVQGEETDYNGYKVEAGFVMAGADVTVAYKDLNTDDDSDGNQGFEFDAAYEPMPGLKLNAGYDMTEENLIGDNKGELGAYYVGAAYPIGDGAAVFARYSTANEMDPDEDINTGSTIGLSLTF